MCIMWLDVVLVTFHSFSRIPALVIYMYMHMVIYMFMYMFLGKVTALAVLCCFALFA